MSHVHLPNCFDEETMVLIPFLYLFLVMKLHVKNRIHEIGKVSFHDLY